jgi:MYXO-CTERM domain-containing protein
MRGYLPSLTLLGALALPATAQANGQSAHLWITEHALQEHLPPGPLADLLTEFRQQLDNGTMFPDGGYPLGDDYAEIAHWEPFQGAYLDWIVREQESLITGPGARNLAFVLGMNSHGMADQLFDSLYMERVKRIDGESDELDTTSDIVFASLVGPRVVPEDWIPSATFITLYEEVAGYTVDPAQMNLGQSLLRFAVEAVNEGSMDAQTVQDAADRYPWGNAHLMDPAVPGNPPCEGEIIARYWQSQWELAHERGLYRPVLDSRPRDGGSAHPTDSTSIDSWITVVFSRGLDGVTADDFTVAPEAGGDDVPITTDLFYGVDSHVAHLKPGADLEPDTVYVVTVHPGVQTIHGESLDGWSFRFSTGDTGPEPINPPWAEGLGGDDGGETGSDDGGDETSGGSGDGGEPATGEGGACACTADGGGPSGGAAVLILLAMGRRRRRPNVRPDGAHST